MTARIELVTHLRCLREAAFDLSLEVGTHTGSMASSKEVAVAGITSGQMSLDDQVTWRAWHFGVPWTMTSRITEYDRPRRFVDEQSHGPFARFRHEHTFELVADGTRMIDRIEFAAPLAWLGVIAERLVLSRYLERLIERRNRYIAELAGVSFGTAGQPSSRPARSMR